MHCEENKYTFILSHLNNNSGYKSKYAAFLEIHTDVTDKITYISFLFVVTFRVMQGRLPWRPDITFWNDKKIKQKSTSYHGYITCYMNTNS